MVVTEAVVALYILTLELLVHEIDRSKNNNSCDMYMVWTLYNIYNLSTL